MEPEPQGPRTAIPSYSKARGTEGREPQQPPRQELRLQPRRPLTWKNPQIYGVKIFKRSFGVLDHSKNELLLIESELFKMRVNLECPYLAFETFTSYRTR